MEIAKRIEYHKLELDSLFYGYENARTPLTQEVMLVLIKDKLVEITKLQIKEREQRMGSLRRPRFAW